jgi:hypothetical protein
MFLKHIKIRLVIMQKIDVVNDVFNMLLDINSLSSDILELSKNIIKEANNRKIPVNKSTLCNMLRL